MTGDTDGIYLAYFSAEFGNSIGMFIVSKNTISGADVGGGIYDGSFNKKNGEASGKITFSMKGGGVTITGAQSDLPVSYDTDFRFQLPLDGQDFHQFETITGPVNVRFEKIRGIA